jgi:hypothetical protein
VNADPNAPPQQIVSGAADAAPASSKSVTSSALWMHRLTVLMFVCVCAGFGVLLVMLPWTSAWTDNRFFIIYPPLRDIAANNFVRGMCSGLGVLDIWIGFSEALNYHEDHRV